MNSMLSRIKKLQREARHTNKTPVVIYHIDQDNPKHVVGNNGTRFTKDEFKAHIGNDYPAGDRVVIIDDIYDPLGVFL